MVQTRRYSLGIIFVTCFGCVFSTCTYPWVAGPWADTLGRTSITFSASNMQGYDLTFRGSSVTTWTCLFQNGSLVLSRSSSVNVAGDDYYLYACMLVNTVSSTKFYYHLMSDTYNTVVRSSIPLRIDPKMMSVTVTDMCTICAQTPTSVSLTVTDYTVMTSDGTTTASGSITSPTFAANPCDPTATTQAPTTTSTIIFVSK
ncbi:hypothetical protein KP79_PYT12696 [Mizuhopecten yessoensis]|uniref:Uncharacterized protein n=1 Tax=Mizuhopecten yessoensis TaxID=6573 RepID=A0A210PLA5_MIZYE|nr:hypothetical protein KP79_PYT12696 [Mizuhopecten yessoensis]